MLLLARTSATNSMTSAEQAKAIVDTIAQAAKDKWGDDWISNLVREYCRLEREETGNEKATPVNRRSQVLTALEGHPRADTLVRLAKAVDAEIQIVVIRREVKRFS
ncbi:hypothetical protein [Phormidesmis sp. 146-33]